MEGILRLGGDSFMNDEHFPRTVVAKENMCEEEDEMNFAAFSPASGTSGHFVASTSLPVTKLQQNQANGGLSQMMVGGMDMGNVQLVQGGTLQATPQLITVPIALPGSKPGDPQQTVQIQVLAPHLLQQQQPKYQMQIPIQGFQQGGAVLTLAYTPEGNDGIQFLGSDGIQVLVPQDMQLGQADQIEEKELNNTVQPHQLFIQNPQIVINNPENKIVNNNNNNEVEIEIKQEICDDGNDDENPRSSESTSNNVWTLNTNIANYINKLAPQQSLPASLQQYLKMNAVDKKPLIDVESGLVKTLSMSEDGSIRVKKKKKYKKKPPKPARPKPGQVIIATSNDGVTVYCCPECHMGFHEKEQLETHLGVHKIERRFICGICGAGLKRKEHLERHKLGHNPDRPFVCSICRKGFKRREHLNLHAVIHSGVKSEVCPECGKGFHRKDHLRKHTRSHESKRARADAPNPDSVQVDPLRMLSEDNSILPDTKPSIFPDTIVPEITIHVPTSNNVQVPVQINIPQHVVSSLTSQNSSCSSTLDALLANHS